MVVVRRSLVRTTSVPVDHDFSDSLPDSVYEAHRTRLISNAALDNSDSLSAASRRNDQQLMKEINDRVAHATISQPSPVLRRRSSIHHHLPVNKPPLPTSSVSVVTSLKSSDVDNDVNREVDLMMPATSRALRSGSVPPASSSSSAAAILAEFSGPPVKTLVLRSGSPVVQLNGSGRYGSYVTPESLSSRYTVKSVPVSNGYYPHPPPGSLTLSADFAVRQAQRDLDRIDQELKTDATFTPRASPVRTIRSHTTTDSRPILRRSSSYHGPSTGARGRSPSPSYSALISPSLPYHYTYSTSTEPVYHTTTRSYTNSPLTDMVTLRKTLTTDLGYIPSATRVHVPALHYSSSVIPSATGLTGDIEALIRSAKTLPEVSTIKTYYTRPSSVSASTFNPSSSSVALTNGLPPVPKPQISTTRRHVREVLCKVKKDPHYYD